MYLNLIKEITDNYITIIGDANHAIPGNNGPYNEEDLPVRNTAHWLVTLSILNQRYTDENYRIIAKRFADYLLLENKYGQCNLIKMRNTKVSDYTNGLIGIAWVIEGLIAAAKMFNDDVYYQRAVELFKAEIFDEKLKMWRIVDIDGKCVSIDYVYNHQLWFAAAGGMILDYRYDGEIDRQIRLFLDSCDRHLVVQPSGLLFHQISFQYSWSAVMKRKIKALLCDLGIGVNLNRQRELEKGYQAFDLYGFALLYKRYKDCKIYTSKRFQKAMNYCTNPENLKKLCIDENEYNKYAFPYNSPAFEYPFLSKMIYGTVDEQLMSDLMNTQTKLCYSETNKYFDRNNADPHTLTARIYELARYYE